MNQSVPTTIDEYIAGCPAEVRPRLEALRRAIREAAPQAAEKISWGMATFAHYGNLVHFSAEKQHIGFHPDPSAIAAFQAELTPYACSKGTVRLPHDQPLPLELIGRMVTFRVAEQERLHAEKQAGKKAPPAPGPLSAQRLSLLDLPGQAARHPGEAPGADAGGAPQRRRLHGHGLSGEAARRRSGLNCRSIWAEKAKFFANSS